MINCTQDSQVIYVKAKASEIVSWANGGQIDDKLRGEIGRLKKFNCIDQLSLMYSNDQFL